MWIRRTLAEIAEVERQQRLSRFNPIRPAWMSIALSLLVAFGRWSGGGGYKFAPAGYPIPISEAFSHFPAICIFLFLIIYGFRVLLGNDPPRDGTLICTRCFEVADRFAPLQCQCGGTREPLYIWRWQKDSEPTNENTPKTPLK